LEAEQILHMALILAALSRTNGQPQCGLVWCCQQRGRVPEPSQGGQGCVCMEALGRRQTAKAASLLLGSLCKGMNRKYCLPALICGSSRGKGGERRERRMILRFSGLRFLHLLPGGFRGLGDRWISLGEIKGKRGGTGGAEPCKALLCNADGMRRGSKIPSPFQSSSSMRRTHTD